MLNKFDKLIVLDTSSLLLNTNSINDVEKIKFYRNRKIGIQIIIPNNDDEIIINHCKNTISILLKNIEKPDYRVKINRDENKLEYDLMIESINYINTLIFGYCARKIDEINRDIEEV